MRTPLYRLLFPVVAAVLLVACGDQSAGPAGKARRSAPAHLVEVETVAAAAVGTIHEATGSLRARRIVRIFNQEEGRITALPHFEGDAVKQGEIILRLEDDLIRAELAKQEASRRQAAVDLKRIRGLIERKVASEDQLAQARTALDIATAEVATLRIRLGYTEVRAPFDALVSARLVEPGDVVSRHSHILTLTDPASLIAEFQLSELLLPRIAIGDEVEVRIDALGEKRLTRRVRRIHPDLDPVTRQGTVEVSLDPVPKDARAGQFCRVTLRTEPRPRILLPVQAVRRDGRGEYVYTVGESNTAHRLAVRGGERIGDHVEIREGLSVGQRVITKGLLGLKEGTVVHLAAPTRDAG